MRTKFLRDERGVAMLLELVLVAAVLSLVGLALYQSNHRNEKAAQPVPARLTAAQAAESVVKAVEQSANDEIAAAAAAEASADELTAVSDDVVNLGGSTNAYSF